MYLMNVPPVAVTQTEWRTCGPPGSYSLPVCFNDSDTELSARGTPISDKVQMIIESLRSTQSSIEMGDEIEGNGPSGQDARVDVCKVAVGSYVGARPKPKSPTEKTSKDVSSPNVHESSDSDSDDSVDRGIEEAILEYLKEKDGHKHKGDPCSQFLQSTKIPAKSPSIPEVSTQTSDRTSFSVNVCHFQKTLKPEVPPGPAAIPIKKYIKNKASLNENMFQSFDPSKNTSGNLVCLKEQAFGQPKPITSADKAIQCPVGIKMEDESNDSSSDDGIEEAIQRYQLEKQEQQTKRDSFIPQAFDEESDDSTSDDGIEEAIRCYQLEQLKERSTPKPFLHKEKSFSKAFSSGSTSTENPPKMKKKRARMEKDVKSSQPLSSVLFSKTLSDFPKGKGLNLFKNDSGKDQAASAAPKITTNAELMCAEAILDISKTVLSEPFQHSVGLSCATTESLQSSTPDNDQDDSSSDSSVDSEDGIEQEIRKFLEQKAQMNKHPPGQESHSASALEAQKKTPRLSITQRRKEKEKNLSVSDEPENALTVEGTLHKPSPRLTVEPNVADQSGDKSSSLDSDEDLDMAIKDLLKTKKRSKKKIRDLKRKSNKCLKDGEQPSGISFQAKKMRLDQFPKFNTLKKSQKSKDGGKEKCKKSLSQQKEIKSKELRMEILKGPQMPHTVEATGRLREDSSSVDSDDSIELEIRRFLAEKAKVSTTDRSPDQGVSRNGTVATVCVPFQTEDIKEENQLAEIPRKSDDPPSGHFPHSPSPNRTKQSLLLDISATPGQSCLTSVQSGCIVEPADGAGLAQKKPQTVVPQQNRPISTPSVITYCSEAIKWRQSLGLPVPTTRPPNRTPFQITSSENKTPSATFPNVGHDVRIVDVWSCARTSKAFPCFTETAESSAYRSSVLNVFTPARQQSRVSFTQSLMPGLRAQCPMEGERERTVHISKDKSVYVELETNRTNHVQVQSRERMEGKQWTESLSERKREGEKIDEKEVNLEIKEEEFIDEPDCESVDSRNPEKKQGFSTLCLSSAIDPGIDIQPCIALNSEDRGKMFNMSHLDKSYRKGRGSVHKKTLQGIKRKLQFVSTGQKSNPASTVAAKCEFQFSVFSSSCFMALNDV